MRNSAAAPSPMQGGQVLQPGAPGPFLVAAQQQRCQPQAAPHQQHARARRATQLVAAEGHQIGAQVVEGHRHVTDGLGRVHVHQHAAGATAGHHLGHRLDRPHLVVAPLQVHQRGAATLGVVGGIHRSQHLVGVDAARAVDADRRHPRPERLGERLA